MGLGLYVFWSLPSIKELENARSSLAAQVYSSDGEVLGVYYMDENRVYVKLSRLPQHLISTLIVTEDARFYGHSGIDFLGFLNIFVSAAQGRARGGSTLTQQLARNLYDEQVGRDRTFLRKAKEALAALYLERRFTKEEILTHYFNTVSFGGNVHGVQAAARRFFAKDCEKLTIEESAVLVGALKATTAYHPVRNPNSSRKRRNVVLGLLAKHGRITPRAADSLAALPLKTSAEPEQLKWEGRAQHFRAYLRKWLTDWCEKCEARITENGEKVCPNIYTDGLKIYTTIDSRLQTYAEELIAEYIPEQQKRFEAYAAGRERWKRDPALLERQAGLSERRNVMKNAGASEAEIKRAFQTPRPMKIFSWDGWIDTTLTPFDSLMYYARFMQPALVALDARSGRVLSWVGGLDYNFFPYDRVTGVLRPGSLTFSGITYAAAIEKGLEPCDIVGGVSLAKGFSENNYFAATEVGLKAGAQNAIALAQKLGYRSPLKPETELFRGLQDVNLLETVEAYAAFAAGGRRPRPILISRIEDKYGNILYHAPDEAVQALAPSSAFLVTELLRGSARRAGVYAQSGLSHDLALGLKTATGPFNGEGWAVGVTPYHSIGVMLGFNDRAVHFGYDMGERIAAPLFSRFIQKLYALPDLRLDPKKRFYRPKDLNVKTDCIP